MPPPTVSEGNAAKILLLEPGDEGLLERVAEGVFDRPIRAEWLERLLADPRQHLVVAVEEDTTIGMASAIHYLHPDKPPELWINEIGVAVTHRRKGLGRRLIEALLRRGTELGCASAWVITDRDNPAAEALYRSLDPTQPPRSQLLFEFEL